MASRDQNKEQKWNPLSECKKNFYIEITQAPYPEGIGKSLWAPEAKAPKLMKGLEIDDCVLHYLTSGSESEPNKIIVGVSRVAKEPIKLSKEDLIKKLQEIGEWSDRYKDFARKWLDNPEYTSFYFVELSDYIEFPRKIPLSEFSDLTGIKPASLQGRYLKDLDRDHARKLLELAFLPIGVAKIAWSYNSWRGIDEKTSEKWRNLKDESSHSYVRETGFAFEWWNFYEGFDKDYYYGYIEGVDENSRRNFKDGLILFISKNPDDGNMYFIGFYGGADILPTPYDTGKKIRDLIPAELEKKLEDYWERGGSQECKEKCEQLLKDVKEGATLRMDIRAKKELSTVFLSGKYIEISQKEDFGEEKLLESINFGRDIEPDKIRRLLERALEKYKEILENTIEPKEREYADGVIKKIEKVLSIYFSYSEINCDEVCKEILGNLKGYKKQVVLYGVPGTGKTYIATQVARALTGGDTDNLYFVTFHPSYSYEEFVEGIRARATGGNGVEFRVEPGVFKVLVARATCGLVRHLYENSSEGLQKSVPWDTIRGTCKEISKSGSMAEIRDEDVNNVLNTIAEWARSNQLLRSEELVKLLGEAPKYVLVIDEINRGDMGRVFGELITLLEEDKRLFGENYIYVTLPYSKARFFIPPNLYIIGTMNSSDRSIAFVDYALRRRFAFYELEPDKEKVPDVKIGEVGLREFFEYLNKYLENTLDRDHRIGHSYFMNIKDEDKARDEFWRVWSTQIRPLLVEYFYGREKELIETFKELYTKSYTDGSEDLDENLKDALESLKKKAEEKS
jgi:DNA replication protein DnaC